MAKMFKLIIVFMFFDLSFVHSSATPMENGFTVDLIHVDSPLSPSYNSSATVYERLERLIRRSSARYNKLVNRLSSADDVTSQMIGNYGQYFMKFNVGTPPKPMYALLDTGSDITWINCEPCVGCPEKEFPMPYFNSNESTTYKGLACTPRIPCTLYHYCSPGKRGAGCKVDSSVCVKCFCNFVVDYADNSTSKGVIGRDTFTFDTTTGGNMSFPLITFGCAHTQNVVQEGDGLVGFGGGSTSLISQLGTLLSAKKFSYCLIPLTKVDVPSGKLSFGTHADIQGEGVVSTPLITQDSQTFFYVTVNAFSVGGVSIEDESFDINVPTTEKTFLLDSGTVVTRLPSSTYRELRSAVVNAIDSIPADIGYVENGDIDLCYSNATSINFPSITVNLDGGIIILQSLNLFVETDDGVTCMAIVEATDGEGVFGSFAQMNFRIKYDLDKKVVSFKGTDCTKE